MLQRRIAPPHANSPFRGLAERSGIVRLLLLFKGTEWGIVFGIVAGSIGLIVFLLARGDK